MLDKSMQVRQIRTSDACGADYPSQNAHVTR